MRRDSIQLEHSIGIFTFVATIGAAMLAELVSVLEIFLSEGGWPIIITGAITAGFLVDCKSVHLTPCANSVDLVM